MQYDIIIRNGRLIDPANCVDSLEDIAISSGKIVSVGKLPPMPGQQYFDAAGCVVTPGLVDFHTHLFAGGSQFGFNPDLMVSMGVTTAVDAGTAGTAGYEMLHCSLERRDMRCFTFLNVSACGQMGSGLNENLDPSLIQEDAICRMAEKYNEEIKGIKVRISRPIVGQWGIEPLKKAMSAAQKLGLPVCVHSTNPCIPMEDLAAMLRPGDILCHMYHGSGDTILLPDGTVKPGILSARERKVVFDAANGRTNFSFLTAESAIGQGFLPDIISTDLTAATVCQGNMVRNLPFILSKYIRLGMSLPDVIRAATSAPAVRLGLSDGTGSLSVGARADIAVFSLENQSCVFQDSAGQMRSGTQMLSPMLTVQNGRVVFDSNRLSRAAEDVDISR